MTKNKKSTKKSGRNSSSKYILYLWLGVLIAMVMAGVLFILIAKTQIPDTKELEQPDYEIASVILGDDGTQIGKAFTLNREWVAFEDLNPHIVDALISTEDERFFSHSGIDARGTLRAIAFMGSRGGASTITQQLAKLFFTDRASSIGKRIWQKLKEWVIAVEFEKRYTKEEIIAMYLNKYDYLYGANGIGAAAKTYFGKDQSKLNVSESAVLVGLLKNSWLYNPVRFPENAHKRRSVVLKQMVRNNKLSKEEYQTLIEDPIDVSNFKRENNFEGLAPYFQAELVKEVKKILRDDRFSKPDGTPYNLYTDGLVIHTTIDPTMQRLAEQAMWEHMSQLQDRYFSRWKGLDPWTYGADQRQKNIRQSRLNRQIRESDRFSRLRKRYLNDISKQIMDAYPNARLWDSDVFRLFNEDKHPGHLANLVRDKTIRKDQAKVYKQILGSSYWPTLKDQWLKLQKAKDQAFNTKTKMTVFAYNNKGYKEVEMTPLDSIKYHNMHMQIGSISVDPETGYIKTWVGGIDHNYFKFDHVRSNRQVGSTFKPFVYGTAIIDLAMSPCQKIQDVQYTIPARDPKFGLLESWSPANADETFSGEYLTLKEGLKQSKNSISMKLMMEIGNVERVRNFASELGIDQNKIPSAPSICLGTPELSVMDLAGAYTSIANDGLYTKPMFIKSIEDANGRVIFTGVQTKKRAIPSSYNYVLVDMLKYAASFIAPWFESEVAGKTGTTNDYKDGWFVGITPDLVVATWVGGDDEWIRFRSLANGQGGVMARPFFTEFLKKLEKEPDVSYDKTKRFKVPEVMVIETDCSIYEDLEQKDQIAEKLKEEREAYDNEFEEEF